MATGAEETTIGVRGKVMASAPAATGAEETTIGIRGQVRVRGVSKGALGKSNNYAKPTATLPLAYLRKQDKPMAAYAFA